jgi:hypothetical protein
VPNGASLQLINNSSDANSLTVLIFRDVTQGFNEPAVAWMVIQNLAQGGRYPFLFSNDLLVSASDSWGNFTPQFPVSFGQAYQIALNASGNVLQLYVPGASNPSEIDVRNDLPTGSINAHLYRSEKLLETKAAIAPGQKVTFAFKPTILLGVVSQAEPGEIVPPSILSELTEIPLQGIRSADIVITGGGSAPYQYTLQNVVRPEYIVEI